MSKLDFSLDLSSGEVFLKNVLKSGNTNDSLLLSQVFETQKIVNKIPLTTFFEIIKRSIGMNYSSRILPFGTIYYQEKESFFTLLLQSNEKEFIFNHLNFPHFSGMKAFFPKSYFLYAIPSSKIQGNDLSLSRTFIFTNGNPIEKFDLKKAYTGSPFPNYSVGYSSGVCWGGSSSPEQQWARSFSDITELEYGPMKYLNSEFNNDLSPSIRVSKQSYCKDIYQNLDKQEAIKFLIFLKSKALLNYDIDNSEMNEFIFFNILDDISLMNIHYGIIVFWAEMRSSFPNFTLPALKLYSNSIERYIENPMGNY